MRFEEQVYTSAAELLERTGGNLGVVAQSRAFPRELTHELEGLRSYPILTGIPVERPDQHPPRYVIGARGARRAYFTVSQIVHAGADHTGRTTPLVHHVVFDRSQLAVKGVMPSDVLRHLKQTFHREWRGPASWIDPPRELDGSSVDSRFPSALWQEHLTQRFQQVVVAVAEGLMRFDLSRQPVLLVIPPHWGHDVLDLVADIYWLLPESVQYALISVSHVVDSSDYIRDAALIVTYRGTAFAEEAQRRRDPRAPRVYDLSAPSGAVSGSSGAYAGLLRDNWPADGARPMALEEWDALGLAPEHADSYVAAVRIRRAMREAETHEAISAAAHRLEDLDAASPTYHVVNDAAADLVERLAQGHQDQPLAFIATDGRWPVAARERSIEALVMRGRNGIRALLDKLSTTPDAIVRDRLLAAAQRQPAIGGVAVEYACTAGSPSGAIKFAGQLIAHSSPPVQTALEWAEPVVQLHSSARASLCPEMAEMLARVAQPEQLRDQLRTLRERDDRARDTYAREICFPVLHRQIDSATTDEGFVVLCDWLVVLASQDGQVGDEIRRVLSRHKGRITDETADRWLDFAQQHGSSNDLREVLVTAGLLRSNQVPPARPVNRPQPVLIEREIVVERAGPIPASVGPITLSGSLALLATLMMMGVALWDAWLTKHPPRPWWLMLVPLAPLLGWYVIERIVRLLFADPANFGTARIVRCVVLSLIVVALIVAGWKLRSSCLHPPQVGPPPKVLNGN